MLNNEILAYTLLVMVIVVISVIVGCCCRIWWDLLGFKAKYQTYMSQHRNKTHRGGGAKGRGAKGGGENGCGESHDDEYEDDLGVTNSRYNPDMTTIGDRSSFAFTGVRSGSRRSFFTVATDDGASMCSTKFMASSPLSGGSGVGPNGLPNGGGGSGNALGTGVATTPGAAVKSPNLLHPDSARWTNR